MLSLSSPSLYSRSSILDKPKAFHGVCRIVLGFVPLKLGVECPKAS